MPRYVVEKDCYGFRKRFWKEGEEVDVKAGEKVPSQFKPLDKKTAGDKSEGTK